MKTPHPSRGSRGQDLVEFGIIFPLLFLFLFGALDLGRAFFSYIAITNAAREGARYGVSYGFYVDNYVYYLKTDEIRTAARNEANASGISLDSATITVACEDGYCDAGRMLRVSVDFQFTPLLGGFLPSSSVTMSRAVEMMIP